VNRTHVFAAAVGTVLLAAVALPVTALTASAEPTPAAPAKEGTPGPANGAERGGEDSGGKRTGKEKPGRKKPGAKKPGRKRSGGEHSGEHRSSGGSAGKRDRAVRKKVPARQEGSVAAAELLAKAGGQGCDPVSKGLYSVDEGVAAAVPVCGADGAVFWKADLDIDCDGQATARCNPTTDDSFQSMTAFSQSDGKPLNAEKLPYIVVPGTGENWDYRSSDIKGGGVAAVIHGDSVRYAVVGDTGPTGIIGEASYATAEGLGIPSNPDHGGAASGVTYILFQGSEVSPIESHGEAILLGDKLARKFVGKK
jgi:hypothetical protein